MSPLKNEGKPVPDRPNFIYTEDQRKQLIRTRVEKDPSNIKLQQLEAMYKLVLIGDAEVGKTSMLLRYSNNIFQQNTSTIGLDFKIKTLKVDKRVIKLQIWDTAGQERYKSITHSYLRNAHCCIVVYDITKRSSFLNVENHISSFLSAVAPNKGLLH